MPQEKVHKETQKQRSAAPEQVDEAPADQRDQSLADDVDNILDEIDEVLEENAEEFVQNYVQKGGELNCRRRVQSVRIHYQRPVNSLCETGPQETVLLAIVNPAIE